MKKAFMVSALVLTIVSSLVAGTMATYTKTLEPLKGSATAKQFYIGSTETAFPKIKLAPTESTVWKFSVINYQNDVPTEVDMDLDIIVNLGAAENRAEIDGLTLALYEGETQLGTTIIRNGTIKVTLPKAFLANEKAQRDFSLRLLWLNGAVSDATDTLNADHFNTSKISVTVTGRQSTAQHDPDNDSMILFKSDFDNMDNIKVLTGEWSVANSKLFAPKSGENRAIFNGTNKADYNIKMKASFLTGRSGSSGYGIYYRATEEPNISGYCFQFDPGLGNSFIVRKFINGNEKEPFQRISMVSAMGLNFKITDPHDIEIEVIGDKHLIKVDGVKILDFSDTSFTQGSVGVRTWSDSKVEIDRAVVTKK